jgi:hypothetical protein
MCFSGYYDFMPGMSGIGLLSQLIGERLSGNQTRDYSRQYNDYCCENLEG